jgi:hypothetical protein
MALKKKKVTRKKTTKKTSTIGSYIKKIQNTPAVKRVSNTIKLMEKKLAAAKKKKAAAVKIARKKLKK